MENSVDHDPNSSKSVVEGKGFTVQGVDYGHGAHDIDEAGVEFRSGETLEKTRDRKKKQYPWWEPKSAPTVIRTKVTSSSGKITPR